MDPLQDDLQSEQEITNKCHSPISRLPPEILSHIFLFCLPGHRLLNVGLYQRTCLLLAQICSYWRDVALSTSRLWTSMHLALWAGSKQSDLEMLDTWLVRSAPCPLTLSVDSPEPAKSIQPGIDVLMQHSSRWEDITLDLSPSSFHALSAIRNSLPCLKTLIIDIPWPLDNITTADAFEFAPQLRRLETGIFLIPSMVKIPWAQLTDCVFNYTTVQVCLETFHQTPHLATSKLIIHSGVVDPSFHLFHVHLNQLSSMTINFKDGSTILFDHLSLPALHYLHYANAAGPSLRRLNSLLVRSACALHTLVLESTFETSISEDEFLEFLQLVPSLVELSLQCGISARACLHLIDQRSKIALASCLVEKLEILRIRRPFGFDDQAFADMVQSRWRSHQTPCRSEASRGREWELARLTTVEIRVLTLRTILGYTIDPRALACYREFRDEGLDIYGIGDDDQRFEL